LRRREKVFSKKASQERERKKGGVEENISRSFFINPLSEKKRRGVL